MFWTGVAVKIANPGRVVKRYKDWSGTITRISPVSDIDSTTSYYVEFSEDNAGAGFGGMWFFANELGLNNDVELIEY